MDEYKQGWGQLKKKKLEWELELKDLEQNELN